MAALSIADYGQIPMSPVLAQTLARASDAAGSQGFPEVTLEHLLSALCDDPDAAGVLDASNVDIARIKGETAEYLMRLPRPAFGPGNGLSVSPIVKRILEAAAAAARGGRRRDINGAIVLAAIIGDGRSAASQMLQAQGLTFDAAIRALQAALTQPPRELTPAPAAAEDVLARARERVQSRTAPSLRDIMQDLPRPVPPPPVPAMPGLPVHVSPPTQSAPPSWPGDFRPMAEAPPEPAPVSVIVPPAAPVEANRPSLPEATPVAAAPTPAPNAPSAPSAAPVAAPVYPAPKSASVPPATSASQPANAGEQAPVAAPALPPPPATVHSPPPAAAVAQPVAQSANAPAPHSDAAIGGGAYAYPTGQPMARPASAQPAMPPPFGGPPQAFDLPRRTGGPLPPPIPGSMPQAGGQLGSAPALNRTLSAPSIAYPGMEQRTPPAAARAPMSQPAPQTPAASQRDAQAKAEAGQLAENIPRTMRVGNSERIEVRIAKARVTALTHGLEGGGLAWRHDVTVTQAMSVRLRAPDGGFFIETASPETQWIENQLGLMAGDDFASWRFLVTPHKRGRARLQIIVSARTVGGDGLAAETALPDQVIEVKVRTNLVRAIRRWSGWILAAVAGGAFAKFGEGALGMAMPLVQEIMKRTWN